MWILIDREMAEYTTNYFSKSGQGIAETPRNRQHKAQASENISQTSNEKHPGSGALSLRLCKVALIIDLSYIPCNFQFYLLCKYCCFIQRKWSVSCFKSIFEEEGGGE